MILSIFKRTILSTILVLILSLIIVGFIFFTSTIAYPWEGEFIFVELIDYVFGLKEVQTVLIIIFWFSFIMAD